MAIFKFDVDNAYDRIVQKGINLSIDFYNTISKEKLLLPGLNLFQTGVESPFLNGVFDTRKNINFNPELFDLIETFFKNYRGPWGLFIARRNGVNKIEQQGFELLEELPAMYFDLTQELPKVKLKGLVIENIHDELRVWIKPIQEGFPSKDNCETYRKLNAQLLIQSEKKLKHFVAYLNNDIAASATLFLNDNSAMIHNLATMNRYRKLGIGSALTLYLMGEAKRNQCKNCFLDSSKEGFNLYRRLGLKFIALHQYIHLIKFEQAEYLHG